MINVHTVRGAFSDAECDRLTALAAAAQSVDAGLVGRQRDHTLRRSDLVWVEETEARGWVMDRMIDVVREANRMAFGFDLDGFDESAQIARYGAERQGHFDWHSDIGEGRFAARRKLTIVVQLSDPAAYEGGVLQVQPSAAIVDAEVDRGAATLFCSALLHRVTPVMQGERFSLTLWAHGPAFR